MIPKITTLAAGSYALLAVSNPLDADVLFHYDFEADTAGVAGGIHDRSGADNDGSTNGFFVTETPAAIAGNTSLRVDATVDSWADVDTPGYTGVGAAADRTFVAWVKTSVAADQLVFSYGTDASSQLLVFRIDQSGSKFVPRVEIGGAGFNGTTRIDDGAWHHLALVVDSSQADNVLIYVDGELDTAAPLALNTVPSFNLRVGGNVFNNQRIWNGHLDDAAFYDEALTADQIASLASGDETPLSVIDAGRLSLTISPTDGSPGSYDFTWESREGKVYDLVSATDLSTPPGSWDVWDGRLDLEPDAGDITTLPGVPGGGDSRRFFAVIEKDPPPPPLQNGSFENPPIADGNFTTNAPPGWIEFDDGNLGDVGIWNPATGSHSTVPDSDNVAQIYHFGSVPMTAFGLSQVLGENFAVDTDYTVTVQIGRSNDFSWPGYRVELWAGATKLAEESNTLVPAADSWTESVVSYTYSGDDAALAGEPLEIRLLSLGEDPESNAGIDPAFSVEFDDVTFTATGP